MPRYTEEELLTAIERLLSELPNLLAIETAQVLQKDVLGQLEQSKDPAKRAASVTQSLEIINGQDAARKRLKALLEENTGKKGDTHLGFEPVPGSPQLPPPLGALVQCSKDPMHWQDNLRVQGERCPICNSLLVPIQ